jgi:hypothetical protein
VAQNGSRLTLGELDTEGVERWVDHKKAQVRSLFVASMLGGQHKPKKANNSCAGRRRC